MVEKTKRPEDHLPLTAAAFHILLALADSEKHGYAIMGEVEQTTDGRMKMGPGTLYGAVKRLLKAGLIVESDSRPDPALDDSRRRYYSLTRDGRRVLAAEVERMGKLVLAAQRKNLSPNTASGSGAVS